MKTRGTGLDVKGELASLKQRFETAAAQYDSLQASAEGAVQQWVWATSPCYHLDPLFFFDAQITRGSIMKAPPRDARGAAAYGLSATGRIVVEHIHLTSLQGRHYSVFYCELEDRIVSYHFHHERTEGCINCAQLIFSDQRPALYQRWATGGYLSCAYVSADGNIRSVLETSKETDQPQERMSRELRYLEDGRVEVWSKWPGEKAHRTFRGIPPADNPFLRGE